MLTARASNVVSANGVVAILLRHRVFGRQRLVVIVNSTVDNEDCID
jgi:hypothetical protein